MVRISKYTLNSSFLHHAKLLLLSVISLAAIGFLLSEDNMSTVNASQSLIGLNDTGHLQTRRVGLPLKSIITDYQQPCSKQEEMGKVDGNSTSGMVPLEVTPEERIDWFRKWLPNIEIFKSDKLAQQFHSRVLEFFNHECEGQFFMTWIKPAQSFGSRELLGVESLFKAHPRGCLVILSRTMDSKQGYRILKPVIDLGLKVHAITPDLSFLFNNTPAEGWYSEMKSGNKDPGEIPLPQNLSNLMRLVVLYKYGGVYLDTDFIIFKSLTGLRNSIGAQSSDQSGNWTRLNNAVMIFDMNHPILLEFIKEFALTFNGNRWGHNGPYLVSRVVERIATRPDYNVTVLLPLAFYPVDWMKINGFFKKPENEAESRWARSKLHQLSTETYGVHLWSRHSSRLFIEQGSIIGSLLSDHCIICKDIYSSNKIFVN